MNVLVENDYSQKSCDRCKKKKFIIIIIISEES